MAKKAPQKPKQAVKAEESEELPPGVKLLRTFEGHQDQVLGVAFDPKGRILASASADTTLKLWDVQSGELLRTLEEYTSEVWGATLQGGEVWGVAFDPRGMMLASASEDARVKLWDVQSGKLLRTLKGHTERVLDVVFEPQGGMLASASNDGTVKLWDASSGELLRTLEGHEGAVKGVAFDAQGGMLASSNFELWDVQSGKLLRKLWGNWGCKDLARGVAFDPQGGMLASSSNDKTVKLWDAHSGKLLRTLEGHTSGVNNVAFSYDGRLLASLGSGEDRKIRLWSRDTWEMAAVIPRPAYTGLVESALTFHPASLLLASSYDKGGTIRIWEIDIDVLLHEQAEKPSGRPVHHTTGKIVLVGDHSVGKSALGHRLIHGTFKEQASTHGQQFWVYPALGKRRADGTECEAILWDFAGQPDYRLVHALFVDNADLALVLFDASDLRDPLHGVEFWLKQLQAGESRCPIILVAAQTDRGTSPLTQEELAAFCQKHGIVGPISTSAFTGLGLDQLIDRMKSLIPWNDKPATVTTATFKRIKDYVLGLKEDKSNGQIIVTPNQLRARLEATDADWQFTDAEMLTAVGHLENYGYVRKLRTSKGEQRILLQPERLNNLASSFVLEARRNPKGLGALEEKRLLTGGYAFPELKDLPEDDRDVLLDAATLLFLEHNVCFRETDPLRREPYLVFPELINLKKPLEEEAAVEDGVAYTASGPTENVFASLVVLLGYTHTFTRTSQWHNNARYEMGDGVTCGFRQDADRDGELDFVLCFCPKAPQSARTLFKGLFESFLERRNLTVMRYEPISCSKGHLLNRSVVRQSLQEGEPFAFCNRCGEQLRLPKARERIQLSRDDQTKVDAQRQAAEQRTQFEQAIFQVQAYVAEQKMKSPETFISYAWGVANQERWVEKRLATDLQKAGIKVVLDRWDNAQIGASVARFVERIEKCDRIVVVGTPDYRRKYENEQSKTGHVVAGEFDVISNRLLGTEEQKKSVLPVLLEGEAPASLPLLLQGRVRADFRDERAYFAIAFDLILSLYRLPVTDPAVADLRETLRGRDLR